MRVSLHLTHNCNLRCTYCYTGEKTAEAMTPQVGRDSIDFVLGLSSTAAEFTFFGGEPLLEFDLMRSLIEYARWNGEQRGITTGFSVITNATLLDRQVIGYLRSRHVLLRVSLDGNRYAHDCSRRLVGGGTSYPMIEEKFSDILEFYPDVLLLMVITPTNLRYLRDSIEELHGRGFRHFVASPAYEAGWNEMDLLELELAYSEVADFYMSQFRQGSEISVSFIDGKIYTHILSEMACGHQCEMARDEIAVAASGRVYPCLRLVGSDEGGATCIGGIYEGIDEERRMAFSFRPGERLKGCEGCILARRCINTCGALNYAITGDIRQTPGVVCAHEKMTIRIADQVANTLYHEKNSAFLERFYRQQTRMEVAQ